MSYKKLLEQGNQFQDYVMRSLLMEKGLVIQCFSSKQNQYGIGESLQGIEIKLDARSDDTGRLSIEIAEKKVNASVWQPSGILREDNTWLYIQGTYDRYFVFSKKTLQMYYRNAKPEIFEYNDTIRKFYLTHKMAKQVAEFVIVRKSEA